MVAWEWRGDQGRWRSPDQRLLAQVPPSLSLFVLSGQVVPAQTALVNAPEIEAIHRLALVRFASVRFTSDMIAPATVAGKGRVVVAPLKLAAVRSAPVKLAPVRFTR